MQVFEYTTNPFGGVVPRPEALPTDLDAFRGRLRQSLKAWRSDGFAVVWLELDLGRASLVPAAVDEGFRYHHSSEDYLMLTRPLVDGAVVPPFATHYIGAGGVVVNGDEELLVVQERVRRAGRHYKLPGGALKVGEHLVEGVVREVKEETGIETRFVSLACFRNMHGYRYGRSDIYFVCRLTPLTHEITMQAEEIDECLWMPVADYYGSDDVSFFNKLIVRAALWSPGVVPTSIEGYRSPESVEVFLPKGTTEIF